MPGEGVGLASVSGVERTLAEELLLIAYHAKPGRAAGSSTDLDCGLAGAVLVELALAGRIEVVDGKVSVLDRGPVGDREIDAALDRIAGEDKRRKPEWWVGKLRSGVGERLLVRLTDRGVLRMHRQKVLWVFSTRSYSVLDSGATSAARAQLNRVVAQGAEPDARTAALAALMDACGLARRAFPGVGHDQLTARMKQWAEGQWTSTAVRNAIHSIHAGVIAASTAGAVAASTTTTG